MQDLNLQYYIERIALFNDEQAFEKLFYHFNDDLYSLAFSFVRSHDIAEELISDVFINVWRNRQQLPEINNLKVYLYVSVKNLCIKFLSRTKQENIIGMDEVLMNNTAVAAADPEQMMVSKEMMLVLQNAVNDLPPKCRLIFKMVREDGLKYKEISQILNISVKTIDAQMAIASKRIAQSVRMIWRRD